MLTCNGNKEAFCLIFSSSKNSIKLKFYFFLSSLFILQFFSFIFHLKIAGDSLLIFCFWAWNPLCQVDEQCALLYLPSTLMSLCHQENSWEILFYTIKGKLTKTTHTMSKYDDTFLNQDYTFPCKHL